MEGEFFPHLCLCVCSPAPSDCVCSGRFSAGRAVHDSAHFLSFVVVSARRQLAGQGERGEKRCRDMEVLLVLRLCCNCTYGNDCSMSESSAVMMCSPVGCHAGAPLRLLSISCYVDMNYSRWLFLRSALNLCCAGIH